MKTLNISPPPDLTPSEIDVFWMQYAYALADKAAQQGEVPVGAVLVLDNQLIAEGWNRSIQAHDPTAHAEIMALKRGGEKIKNYRLVDATLYVTLEPCPMCAGALVHARIKRLVYGASDFKTGAVGSVFNLVEDTKLNHQIKVESGVLEQVCSQQISAFFKARRQAHKINKALAKKKS
ncbi:tRNA-specific adenosine-34 deaminase [hydrothermal vent metagenome]|uniref:tRNA-specific adenosine deaminase 2 n=1 Tax=hydrothermal vent metagenome TaxID=652676 RepID=A0A3B0W9P9_9ZZZZ